MKYAKLERIVKTYYDNLEDGKVLGRKCTVCGHIEFPPYLACNACGNLDTEWVDLTNTRAKIVQVLPPLNVFPEAEFAEENGGFVAVAIKIDNADPYVTSMVHVGKDAYEKIHENMDSYTLKPYIIQGADTKICSWVDENFKEAPKAAAPAPKAEAPAPEAPKAAAPAPAADANDDVVKAVIAAAADGYDVDPSIITLATDIREDLAPQSMKMIVMLSNIEEALDITIDITEAGELNTIADFVNAVRGKLGIEGTVSADAAAAAPAAGGAAGGAGEIDEVTKVVIDAAADAYDVDASVITPSTDIREDLAPQSMKMIVMLSNIEEALDITIDITEAGELNTIAEFAAKVKEKMN